MLNYPVQLVVETTRVADRVSISRPTPQRRLRGVAVGAAHTPTCDHSLLAQTRSSTRSQHIRPQRNVARQLINLWLTTISSLFDRATVDKQTH